MPKLLSRMMLDAESPAQATSTSSSNLEKFPGFAKLNQIRSAKVRNGQTDTAGDSSHTNGTPRTKTLLQDLNPANDWSTVTSSGNLNQPRDAYLRKAKKQAHLASIPNGPSASRKFKPATLQGGASFKDRYKNVAWKPQWATPPGDAGGLADGPADAFLPTETSGTSTSNNLSSRIGARLTTADTAPSTSDSENSVTRSPSVPRGGVSASSVATPPVHPHPRFEPQVTLMSRTSMSLKSRAGTSPTWQPADKAILTDIVTAKVAPIQAIHNNVSTNVTRVVEASSGDGSANLNNSTSASSTASASPHPSRSTIGARQENATLSDIPLDTQTMSASLPTLASDTSVATSIGLAEPPAAAAAAPTLDAPSTTKTISISSAQLDEPMMMSPTPSPPRLRSASPPQQPSQPALPPALQESIASLRTELTVVQQTYAQVRELNEAAQKAADVFTTQANRWMLLAESLFNAHGLEEHSALLQPPSLDARLPTPDTSRALLTSTPRTGDSSSYSGANQSVNEPSTARGKSMSGPSAYIPRSAVGAPAQVPGSRYSSSVSVSPLRPAEHDSEDEDPDDIYALPLPSAQNRAPPVGGHVTSTTVNASPVKREPAPDSQISPSLSENERHVERLTNELALTRDRVALKLEERAQAQRLAEKARQDKERSLEREKKQREEEEWTAAELKRRIEEQQKQREKIQKEKKLYLENVAAQLKHGRQPFVSAPPPPPAWSVSAPLNLAPFGDTSRFASSLNSAVPASQLASMVITPGAGLFTAPQQTVSSAPPRMRSPVASSAASLGDPLYRPSAYGNLADENSASPSQHVGRIRRRNPPADDQGPQAKKARIEFRNEAEQVLHVFSSPIRKRVDQEGSNPTATDTKQDTSDTTQGTRAAYALSPQLPHRQPATQMGSPADAYTDHHQMAARSTSERRSRSLSASPAISIGENPAENSMRALSPDLRLSRTSPIRNISS